MNKNLETYVTMRLDKLSKSKYKILNLLESANKNKLENELNINEKDMIELKQEFYLISGALAELEELKRTFII